MGRGDRLGEALVRAPYEEMTVEDLLRVIRSLGPDDSVVPPVEHGLHFLDSRALAALLKELAKVPPHPRFVPAHLHPPCCSPYSPPDLNY